MKMTITAKKMQIPQNFTEYAEKRLNSKLNKFFGEEADAKITMATHKNLIVIELTVDYNNMKYRAACTDLLLPAEAALLALVAVRTTKTICIVR